MPNNRPKKMSIKAGLMALMSGALLVVLGACNSSSNAPKPSAAEPRSPSSSASPSTSTQRCPSQDFDAFLADFANDEEVQRTHVTNPLESESVDVNAEPEPKPVTRWMPVSALRFPLMKSIQQQDRSGFKRTLSASGTRGMEVKIAKEDTDEQTTFFFRNEGCWMLYRMQDDSL